MNVTELVARKQAGQPLTTEEIEEVVRDGVAPGPQALSAAGTDPSAMGLDAAPQLGHAARPVRLGRRDGNPPVARPAQGFEWVSRIFAACVHFVDSSLATGRTVDIPTANFMTDAVVKRSVAMPRRSRPSTSPA